MKNPNTKLVLDLALMAIGLILMCVGIRWLFLIGLGLIAVPDRESLFSRKMVGGIDWLISGFLRIGGVALILWFFSYGREPMPWSTAAVIFFAAAIPEFYFRRSNRSKAYEA